MHSKGKYFDGPSGAQDRRILFLVEGADDAFFLDTLLSEASASASEVGIKFIQGKTGFALNIADLIKTREWVTGSVQRFAVILDADESPIDAEQAIGTALAALSLPTPKHGEVLEFDVNRRVGLFVVPSSAETGHLEKLLLSTVNGSDLFTAATDFVANHDAARPENARLKRVMQAYLSCVPPSVRGGGRAFRLGEFDHGSSHLDGIRTFVKLMLAP